MSTAQQNKSVIHDTTRSSCFVMDGQPYKTINWKEHENNQLSRAIEWILRSSAFADMHVDWVYREKALLAVVVASCTSHTPSDLSADGHTSPYYCSAVRVGYSG